MKDFHPVRFHLTDEEYEEAVEACKYACVKRGVLAKQKFMATVREINAARPPKRNTAKK